MALGCRSVREFLRENDSRDITELMAFYQLEPFGQDWHQTARICAAIYGAICGKGAPGPDEFLPVKPPEQPQSPEDMAAIFRSFAREHNKKKNGHNRKP